MGEDHEPTALDEHLREDVEFTPAAYKRFLLFLIFQKCIEIIPYIERVPNGEQYATNTTKYIISLLCHYLVDKYSPKDLFCGLLVNSCLLMFFIFFADQ